IEVNAVADSKAAVAQNSMNIAKIIESKEKNDIRSSGYKVVDMDWINESDSDILIDAMPASDNGRREYEIYSAAMHRGKDVVTANKSGLANYWKEIMDASKNSRRNIRYEATVAGGVPLFSVIDFSLMPSEVTGFRGIVSLTVNYFIRRMAHGEKFEDILADARKLGILETNYHDDTMGIDAARKSVILANSLFGTSYTVNDVVYRGVENLNEDEINSLTANTRIVTEIERMGNKVNASSKPLNLNDGDFLLKIAEKGLGFQIITDSNGTVNVTDDYDGPYETAGGVVNDVIISAVERINGNK
ncbi:MAG: homoserine dehydrogenase, partial [Thermoplasmata archaeon]